MTGWNRERLIFALSLLVLAGSAIHAGRSFIGGDVESIHLQEPAPASVVAVGSEVAIDWYAGGGPSAPRDPFQAKSEWRLARPDPLPLPPHGALERRIPLPAPVARSPRAWPGLEAIPPETVEDLAPNAPPPTAIEEPK
jgi:hypothetical protein